MAGGVFRQKTAARVLRRDERYETEGLTCPAGKVIDLSASGMRIRSESKPKLRRGDVQSFALSTGTRRLTVQGSVAWVRRTSLFGGQYEIGVRLVNLSPSMRTVLRNLAQYGFLGRLGHDAGGGAAPSAQTSPPPPPPQNDACVNAEIELDDHYATLGVERTASLNDIRAAYRHLATKHHPDTGGDAETFVRINKAWSILKDPASRIRYDQMVSMAMQRKSA